MQARIETLKAKNNSNEEYLIYPRTLTTCITNEDGENLDTIINNALENCGGGGGASTAAEVSYDDTVGNIPFGADNVQDAFDNLKGILSTFDDYVNDKASETLDAAKAYTDENAGASTANEISYDDNNVEGMEIGVDNVQEALDAFKNAFTGMMGMVGDALDEIAKGSELYTDTEVADALLEAKSYTDTSTAQALTDAKTYAETQAASAVADAKSYTDTASAQALTDAKAYNDSAYANANAYADQKITDLINGAPTTLDTLKEIADAMAENDEVVDALDEAIGTKANQSELDTHTGNNTIHITVNERTKWNDADSKKHEHSNKTVLDNTTASFTTEDKTKLVGIEANANNFSLPTGLSTGYVTTGQQSGTTLGEKATAEGIDTTASGFQSHAEGSNTTAYGNSSHAEGSSTDKATGTTVEEILTNWDTNKFSVAFGEASHAEGKDTLALGAQSHAEGLWTKASGTASHAEGGFDEFNGNTIEAGTVASGVSSHAEGAGTVASGTHSHAEGHFTQATHYYTHAEGAGTVASGQTSHAEGNYTTASGSYSHAEGNSTNKVTNVITDYSTSTAIADIQTAWNSKAFSLAHGEASHVEGKNNLALKKHSHAEGEQTTASGMASHTEGYWTTASGYYSHAEGTSTTASGDNSHTEGSGAKASESNAHAEGYFTTASGNTSHAEGSNTTASGYNAHAEGGNTTASGDDSHAEGYQTQALNMYAHAEGYYTTASGNNSHAEGEYAKASGIVSHAEGEQTTASNYYTHAEGYKTTASGNTSHAEGYQTTASNYASHVSGKYNKAMTNGGGENTQVGDVFVIGNGTKSSALSNALRVTYTGETYGLSAFNSSGADYAEFIYPWHDDNKDNEDRIGYFVTFKDGKLYKATSKDLILGVTSGNPSIVGNADEDYYWRYERDEFSRIVFEDVEEIVEKRDEEGNPVLDENGSPVYEKTGNIIKNGRMKLNENYDPSLQDTYAERKNRKEWDYVGMMGVLPTRDDGTCIPGQYCKCNDEGIATLATPEDVMTNRFTFIVLERVNDHVVKIVK